MLAWLNSLFGYNSNRDLLADIKEAAEGFDASGHSFVYLRLIARGDKLKIRPADLARCDDNVRAHLRAINARRSEPITLRYFQHLAALYTEVFLDRYFNHRAEMLRSLNDFVAQRNARKLAGEAHDLPFTEADLKKLALWMATGSGKTLIMHINYYQFLHYRSVGPDEDRRFERLERSGCGKRYRKGCCSGLIRRLLDDHGVILAERKIEIDEFTVQLLQPFPHDLSPVPWSPG